MCGLYYFIIFFKVKDARSCLYTDRNDLEREKMIQKKEVLQR